jgi:ribonuclease-3
LEESGPDHDKVFVVEAIIDGQALSRGTGRNKKAAEQQAAYQVLKEKLL